MSAMPSRALLTADRTPLLLVGTIVLGIGLLYASSIAGILELWENSEYRHGALVLPISAYLLWRARGSLASAKVTAWWPGIAAVALLVAVWWLARLLDIQVAEQLAVMLLVLAVVASVLGLEFARRALFPLAFLVAAVPMGDGLLPLLVRVTADTSTLLLELSGVPVYREGQFLTLPGGNFEVADVCSGLNYLVSGLMVATLFAYLTFSRNWKRAVFLGVTIGALIFANGVRAFVVMYVASATDLRYMAGRDHVWFGWVLFAVVIMALFVIGSRWADVDHDTSSATGSSERARGAAAETVWPLAFVLALVLLATAAQRFQALLGSSWKFLLPSGVLLIWVLSRYFGGRPNATAGGDGEPKRSRIDSRSVTVAVVAVALLAAGPLLAPPKPRDAPTETAALALADIAGCARSSAASAARGNGAVPDFAGAATYDCLGNRVHALVAGYWGTGPAREAHLLVPPEWRSAPVESMTIDVAAGRRIEANALTLRDQRIWYWFRVGESSAASPIAAKLLLGYEVLRSKDPTAGVVLLQTPLTSDPDAERQRLAQVAAALAGMQLPDGQPAQDAHEAARRSSRTDDGLAGRR